MNRQCVIICWFYELSVLCFSVLPGSIHVHTFKLLWAIYSERVPVVQQKVVFCHKCSAAEIE